MTRLQLLGAAGVAALLVTAACSDMVAPTRGTRYDWRLVVPYDSAGPRVDTLSFHWPRNRLPVRIWVEDQYNLPARVREGISLWKGALLYGEWDATVVQDSTTADVIIRAIQPPPQTLPAPPLRLGGAVLSCEGATDLDTVSTRFELAVPVRAYVFPTLPNAPDLTQCLRTVTAHELGHTLGLFQHSTDSLDLMFTTPVATGLTERDFGTINNAYHYPADMLPIGP
ncbi:MAG: matrixin family metalloprotease [Gemmatimonadetes bacterium]|nr:matrixin family metalloprotease [Gemmatimonadota bacterium]